MTSLDTVQGLSLPLNVSNEHVHQSVGLPCPDGGWIKGVCKEHGTVRWVRMSCKRRTCPVCREVRRQEIAARISYGLERLAGEGPTAGGGWLVLTFDDTELTKAQRNRISNQMVKWIKRYLKRVHDLDVEWVKVWERHRSGKLHLNILFSPWRFIPQQLLARKWHIFGGGIDMWVKRVGRGVGATARSSRYKVGLYFGKYDQMVFAGKGITYSKGWPRRPKEDHCRRGEIAWEYVSNVSQEGIMNWYNIEMGNLDEVAAGEYATKPELCDCFEFRPSVRQIAGRIFNRYRDGPR